MATKIFRTDTRLNANEGKLLPAILMGRLHKKASQRTVYTLQRYFSWIKLERPTPIKRHFSTAYVSTTIQIKFPTIYHYDAYQAVQ